MSLDSQNSLCDIYRYTSYSNLAAVGTNTTVGSFRAGADQGGYCQLRVTLPTKMKIIPKITLYSGNGTKDKIGYRVNSSSGYTDVVPTLMDISSNGFNISYQGTAGTGAGILFHYEAHADWIQT